MVERFIILNRIKTPDGTIIESKNRHDYVEYKDKNGKMYAVDGGNNYIRRVCDNFDYEELSVYSDAPHEEIREALYRGGRGINGDEPLKYVLLKDMNDDWVKAVIEYEEKLRPYNKFLPFYRAEVEWRKLKQIKYGTKGKCVTVEELTKPDLENDPVVSIVFGRMKQRSKVGKEKYGVGMDRTDLSAYEWAVHAQEEAMDLSLYLERVRAEFKEQEQLRLALQEIIKETPNDSELGKKLRIILE